MANNLTRDEAHDRAGLLTVQSYLISLDLTGDAATFRSDTTVTFTATRPDAESFIDLTAAEVREISLNGTPVGLDAFTGDRVMLTGLAETNEL
ncbi:MAG: aminopeptidase N, partial [Actinomycetota bacterium]